jgi:hypothetical protein
VRVAVEETGYASAVEALVSGNQLAARTATGLSQRLDPLAGMAGDDSTATEFAASYDTAAAAIVAALEPLVGSFAALARLTSASLANHAHAEARSVLPDWAQTVTGPPTLADRCVGVRLPRPPSALGHATARPAGVAALVFDRLHDVFWPNADTDRVRDAAAAWRTAATSLHLLTARCDSAHAALADQRSPEIPIALTVTASLRGHVEKLTDQLTDLAQACETYADDVEAKRGELLDLLKDLAEEFLIGGLIAGGLSLISGGTALGAAGTAATARIATASTRFRHILETLRLLTSGTATGLRPIAVEAGAITTETTRISRARVLLMEAGEGAASASGRLPGRFHPGWLSEHEGTGHTIERHVGRSVEQLRRRFVENRRLRAASTFRTQAEAESSIEQTLQSNASEIRDWLRTATDSKAFFADVGHDAGHVLIKATGEMIQVSRVKVVLVPDATAPHGWIIRTAHPMP